MRKDDDSKKPSGQSKGNSPQKRILLYDVELGPNTAYVWPGRMYEINAIKIIKNWELLTFAYKWLGDKDVTCLTRAGKKTDKSLVGALWALMDEADVVVAHNGLAFDNKHVRTKFLSYGLTPPTSVVTVDTRNEARRLFNFDSNKLDDLGARLGVGRKLAHEGFELWEKCLAGEKAAFEKMAEYNIQDVALLERVYLKLRPWMDRHPNVRIDAEMSCPKCGSTRMRSHGLSHTKDGSYRRYECRDCGGRAKSRQKEKGTAGVKLVGE